MSDLPFNPFADATAIPAGVDFAEIIAAIKANALRSTIAISTIRLHADCQARVTLDEDTVGEYACRMKEGAAFPPVTVFFDGSDHWLADGFHRWAAAKRLAGERGDEATATMPAEVRQGTRTDAVRHALAANAAHGKRRDPGDYRKGYEIAVRCGLCDATDTEAVRKLLACSERWARDLTATAREQAEQERNARIIAARQAGEKQAAIAKREGVTQGFVSKVEAHSKRQTAEWNIQAPPPPPPPAPERWASDLLAEDDEAEAVQVPPSPLPWSSDDAEPEPGDIAYALRTGHIEGLPLQNEEEDEGEEAEDNAPSLPEPVHNHRAQGTGENEWYTPPEFIEAARSLMGGIDLDPASSPLANKTVQAERILTAEDDGLAHEWGGRVWLNPPYAQPWIARFAEKLVAEVAAGRVREAVALTHNYTDTGWFHHLARAAKAICLTRGRIAFVSPEGKKAAPTQGQAFFYFGDGVDRFAATFAAHGLVVVRHE